MPTATPLHHKKGKLSTFESIKLGISAETFLLLGLGLLFGWLEFGAATKALNANNVFLIQKGSRDIRMRVFNSDYRDMLKNKTVTDYRLYDDKDSSSCEKNATCLVLGHHAFEGTWALFNNFMSVYRLSELGAIPVPFSETFSKEFCGFVKRPAIEYLWFRQGQSHIELVQKDGPDGVEKPTNGGKSEADKPEDPYEEMRETWCNS